MKKLMIPAAVGALAVVLAACGSTTKTSSSATNTGSTSKVLVDASGMALYTPEGETASNVRCTGACVSIWKPLRPGGAKLTNAGKLGVITRPDGSKQVTAGGKPLYTFAQDSPGAVTGNGASDSFGGKHFTWHVVKPGGTAAPASAPSGGGYSSGY